MTRTFDEPSQVLNEDTTAAETEDQKTNVAHTAVQLTTSDKRVRSRRSTTDCNKCSLSGTYLGRLQE